MSIETFLIAIVPVPLFYIIYSRYFLFRPEIYKHIESFFAGLTVSLLLVLLSPLFLHFFPETEILTTAFLRAAVLEKIFCFIIIIIIQRHYTNFSILEATISGMLVGLGFSFVENIVYSLKMGSSIIIIRNLYSVPLHLTTCGIMGYYLGIRKQSVTMIFKVKNIIKSIAIPLFYHTTFDYLLLSGKIYTYLSMVVWLAMIVTLEFLIARCQIMLPLEVLKALKLRYEDWALNSRQKRYERWIEKSIGSFFNETENLFQWKPGIFRLIFVIFFFIISIVGLAYRYEIVRYFMFSLNNDEQILILGLFPASISTLLIIVGAINPNFFRNSELSIPIISDLEIKYPDGSEETLVSYDVTSINAFLRTSSPIGIDTEVQLKFLHPHYCDDYIRSLVVWENHHNPAEPFGTIVKFYTTPWSFKIFLMKYSFFKIRKGVVYNLKLPGFELTRKLFLRPISIMQTDNIYKKGDIIFSQNEKAESFYMLKKGSVLIYKKSNYEQIITMGTVDEGEIFGEMAIITKDLRSASAICLSECVIAVSDKKNLLPLLESNTEFSKHLILTIINRFATPPMYVNNNINHKTS